MNTKMFPFLLALLLTLFAGACSKQTAEKTLYTCGMHSQIVRDQPGNCPICGMTLVPMKKNAASPGAQTASERSIKYYKSTMMLGEISKTPRKDSMGMEMAPVYEGEEEGSSISVNPATVQKMGVRTAPVTRGAVLRIIRTVGAVDYNETALADVTTKFRGWIENLYVDSTGKEVKKGEPLFDIYSPDLYSAQNEYVLALNQNSPLRNSARQKLKLFDISDDQIAELEKSRQPKRTLRVDAPIDGVVVEKNAVRGQMVEAGMKLYRLADLGIVWVQSQIYEQDMAVVRVGQEAQVSLSYLADRKFSGRVTYIYPTVDEKTRTARVRMEFHNPGLFLKPGMFATIDLRAEVSSSALLVPDTAVLRSGAKNTVFVATGDGHFEPREVKLGARSENNMLEVLSGLKENEKVVVSGQFMLDSESQLREAIQKMLAPNTTPQPVANAEHASAAATPTPQPSPANESFVCPMPEHAPIKYNHGGKCPICGMTLIPAPPETTAPVAENSATPH